MNPLLASLIETADDGAVYYDDGRYVERRPAFRRNRINPFDNDDT